MKILSATFLLALFCAGVTAKPVKHYVFFGMDREDDKGFLRSVYKAARELRVGVGGPDILPYNESSWTGLTRSFRINM